MIRRLFLVVAIALLATALVAPVAAAAGPVKASPHGYSQAFQCYGLFNGWNKAGAQRLVQLVKEESQTSPPSAASEELVSRINGYYSVGCGHTLDQYVDARTNGAQFSWYRAVVELNT